MRSWKDLIIMLLITSVTMVAVIVLSEDQVIPSGTAQNSPPVARDSIRTIKSEELYGIQVDSLKVDRGTVQYGESLAAMLYPYGVTAQQIYLISQLSDSLIDEKKIQAGNCFSVLSTSDTTPLYFVYEKDPVNYVVIQFEPDKIRAMNGRKHLEKRTRFASGTIESSLWESMQNSDCNPMLAIELSEIFAWSIDFFGVQNGDKYKVIYEETFVDSSSMGIDRILGAWFFHNQTDFWAIPYEQDGVRSFFDENGNSLRKAFLKAPLRFSRISSGFSHSRLHPILKIRRPHHGVDYVAPTGTPVHTVGDGVVVNVGYQKSGGGNYIKIKHNSVYSTTYMHLSRFAKGLRKGNYVKQGDVIGYVGKSGLATGPHLDFRFYMNGSAVNPLKVKAPPVEPVHKENLETFRIVRSITMESLKLL